MDSWKRELTDKKIYIWGASIGGAQAYKSLQRNGLQVTAYCDNNRQKQGTLYNGAPVISPEQLQKRVAEDGSSLIIIASFAFETIYRQISAQGIRCPVYIYLLYDPCHLKSGMIPYTEAEKQSIREVYADDTYTRSLLDLILDRGFLNTDAFGRIEDYLGFGGIDAYYYDDISAKVSIGGGTSVLC